MGVVYEAFDRELRARVALKTLWHADGHWLAQFKREFRSLHDLAHRNIVTLGEFFDGESAPFFTMELVRGVNILDHVRGLDDPDSVGTRSGPMARVASRELQQKRVAPIAYDEPRLRAALRQLAAGIAALHAVGKVHRDIKPSNVLVAEDGRVVLLDFGLVAETTSAAPSTDEGAVGTVAYVAPEQALTGEVTPAADWYGVGVILFEALTGALPYEGQTSWEILVKKQQGEVPRPRALVDTVPPDLDALCAALLQPQAADRPGEREILDRLGADPGPEPPRARAGTDAGLSEVTPFVGRADQLAQLRAGFERSREAALVCVVEGVSGVGKSQLVEQFVEQLTAHDPDIVVLASRCYEREVVSYKAFDGIAAALARYLTQRTPAQVAALLPREPALLGRLFPVLKRVEAIAEADAIPDMADPQAQRLRMFAALRELFVRLAARTRLVWFIDDLQWSDADSLVLLQDLIAHEERLPVFVVATMRPVDDGPRQALLASVAQLVPTERMILGELSRAEARELAGLLLPDRDPATLDAVAADAGGHPLFLQELARHTGTEPGGAAIGATLDEMLTARIDRLAPAVQTLLEVVCLFGGPVTQEV
ncbi:MAG: protein kinase, partial [Deltaproteobacteria bacterium]|nr:protein kinase [Deltaproteobacteria bacterium]